MKLRFILTGILLGLLSVAAFAADGPQTMPISCKSPNPDPQSGLHRIKGDSDMWTFAISLEGGARFVDGPYWSYPGKGGNDPDWGMWTDGKDGDSSLGWSSPQKTGSFGVGVNGQIVCGSGGDGEPIDFAAGWNGEVEVGESSASLKIYKDAALTEEADDVIGGTVYVALEIALGEGQKLASGNATLRVEENYEQHNESERRWDQSVGFSGSWLKKDNNGEWQSSSDSPQSINNSGEKKYFCKVWTWNTTSKPLGHNEEHTVQLIKVDGGGDTELSFTPTSDGDDGKSDPGTVSTDVGNLVIDSVTPQDYFALGDMDVQSEQFDPAPPPIQVDLDDDDLNEPVNIEITLRSTTDPATVVRTIRLDDMTGRSHSIEWDGKDDTGNIATPGYYTFDVKVTQPSDNDMARYRSNLSLINHGVDFLTATDSILNPKPLITDENNKVTTHVTYSMSETPLSGSVAVELYDVDFSLEDKVTGIGNQIRDEANPVVLRASVSNYADAVTLGRVIITASDDHLEQYRDHQPHRMLAWNKTRQRYKISEALQYILNGQVASNLYWMRRGANKNTNNWYKVHSWAATSGALAYANDPTEAWSAHHQGPTPLVLQIAEPKPYRIGPREITSEKGILIKAIDPATGKVKIHGFKYHIRDDTMANGVFTNSANSSQKRGDQGRLLIHPDGSGTLQTQDVFTGSEGCIALKPGVAFDFENYMEGIRNDSLTKARWYPRANVKTGGTKNNVDNTVEWFPLFLYQTCQTGTGWPGSSQPGLWTQLYFEVETELEP